MTSDSNQHNANKKIVLVPLIVSVFIIVFILYIVVSYDKNKALETFELEQIIDDNKKIIPNFVVYNKDNVTVAFDNSLIDPNKWSAVNFFASWCVPCLAEIPILNALSSLDIDVYGIAWKDKPEDTIKWLKDNEAEFYKYGFDVGEASVSWGIIGVPETFLLYKNSVVFHHVGALTEDILKDRILPIIKRLE